MSEAATAEEISKGKGRLKQEASEAALIDAFGRVVGLGPDDGRDRGHGRRGGRRLIAVLR